MGRKPVLPKPDWATGTPKLSTFWSRDRTSASNTTSSTVAAGAAATAASTSSAAPSAALHSSLATAPSSRNAGQTSSSRSNNPSSSSTSASPAPTALAKKAEGTARAQSQGTTQVNQLDVKGIQTSKVRKRRIVTTSEEEEEENEVVGKGSTSHSIDVQSLPRQSQATGTVTLGAAGSQMPHFNKTKKLKSVLAKSLGQMNEDELNVSDMGEEDASETERSPAKAKSSTKLRRYGAVEDEDEDESYISADAEEDDEAEYEDVESDSALFEAEKSDEDEELEGEKDQVIATGNERKKRKQVKNGSRNAEPFSQAELKDIMDVKKRKSLVGEMAFAAFLWHDLIAVDGARATHQDLVEWWKKRDEDAYETLYPLGHNAHQRVHARVLSTLQKGLFGNLQVEDTGGATFWYGFVHDEYEPSSPFEKLPYYIWHLVSGSHGVMNAAKRGKGRIEKTADSLSVGIENNRNLLASHLGLTKATFGKAKFQTIWLDSTLAKADSKGELDSIDAFSKYAVDVAEEVQENCQKYFAIYSSLNELLGWMQKSKSAGRSTLIYLPCPSAWPFRLAALKALFEDEECLVGDKVWLAYPKRRRDRDYKGVEERMLDSIAWISVTSLLKFSTGMTTGQMTAAGIPLSEGHAVQGVLDTQKVQNKSRNKGMVSAYRDANLSGKYHLPLDGGKTLAEMHRDGDKAVGPRVIAAKKIAVKKKPAKKAAVANDEEESE